MSLFGRDDTKQAKSLIFIVLPQVEQFPKVQKKQKNKKNPQKTKTKAKKKMLDVVRTYNNSNHELT